MTQAEPVREPCPHCAELAALSGIVCPHCHGSLLVDLILDQPVRDSRTRFQLARSLSQLGASSFQELQTVLASPRPVVFQGVTRAVASSAQELLQPSGLRTTTAPSAPKKKSANVPVLIAGSVAAVALLAVVLWMLSSSGSPPTDSTDEADQPSQALSTQEIAETVTPSVVSLTCRQSVGSGFFVTEEQLLTNDHVLCPAGETLKVHFSDGRQLRGTVIDRNEDLDLALVEVPGAAAVPLPLGDAAHVGVGEKVVIVGTPLGMEYTVHEGTVSHAARNLYGVAYIQVDANVNPGNSGGPLIDTGGNVVGVISLQVQGASGLGFALPINYAYSHAANFVAAPATDLTRWGQVVQQIEEDEEYAVQEAGQAFIDPGVAQAFAEGGQRLLVIILRRSMFPPSPGEEIPFSIMREGMTVCSGSMPVVSWAPFDAAPEASSELPQFKWLRKHDLTSNLYWGAAYFHDRSCADAGSLVGDLFVLDRGDPDYDRVTIMPRQ